MNKIYYRLPQNEEIRKHYKIDDFISPVLPNTPKWWQKLTPYLKGSKSVFECWNKLNDNEKLNYDVYSTVKLCPGFHNLFKNSFLIKFPCDILLEHGTQDNQYVWRVPSVHNPISVTEHSTMQHGHSDHMSQFLFLKFTMPIELTVSAPIDIMYFDAMYWVNNPYRVAPGVVAMESKSQSLELNIIVAFPKTQETHSYQFTKGSPLALLRTSERVQLENNEELRPFHRKRFSSSFKWDSKAE